MMFQTDKNDLNKCHIYLLTFIICCGIILQINSCPRDRNNPAAPISLSAGVLINQISPKSISNLGVAYNNLTATITPGAVFNGLTSQEVNSLKEVIRKN
jgi:hypothetical protein